MTAVLDSSALLAFLQDEPGGAEVEAELSTGRCSAANWSETLQKVAFRGGSAPTAGQVLLDYGLQVEPVTRADAERAADLWARSPNLSLADRLCLALGERLHADVWTADRAWGTGGRVRQLRQ